MKTGELYAYHRWANRRLFDTAATLGEEACGREIGRQFSVSTLRGMFAHLYGADAVWLARWRGQPTAGLPGRDIPTMAALRATWDGLEAEQRAFVESLTTADLAREIRYQATDGSKFQAPLGVLLQHVVTHGNHHRSEIATMLTMTSGSPPETSVLVWHRILSGQVTS